VLELNLTGPFLTMKAVIPQLIEAGGGSIINVSSPAGLVNSLCLSAYRASKGGLIGLSKQVASGTGRARSAAMWCAPGPPRPV
jgi:NAD(P)-dependent dehydrogenase (short-subunit alcohol dehydrogenase family)